MEKAIYLKCERCGHEWTQKGDNEPKTCTSCKSLYWKKPMSPYWKEQREKRRNINNIQ